MHPTIYGTFERICAARSLHGRILEVGAIPGRMSLLRLHAFNGHVTEKVGINLDGPHECDGYHIVRGNSNCMDMFDTASFDAVLSNATLEHDKFFWQSIAEMHRVLKPGGTMIIGTPGYGVLPGEARLKRWLRAVPGGARIEWLSDSTATFRVHNHPGDYYRFSPQTHLEVFFAGFRDVRVESLMIPPRIIGVGIKS
jgi:SAM-dependent methyltransferase